MYIYIITNIENEMQYVGQTKNNPLGQEYRNGRIYEHLNGYANYVLNNDVEQYGKESFQYLIIKFTGITQDELYIIEYDLVDRLNTLYPNGYNLKNQETRSHHLTDEDIDRLRREEEIKQRVYEQEYEIY